MKSPKRVTVTEIQPYYVQDAASTIARAREHLANPKMVKAIKAHLEGLGAALGSGLKQKSSGRKGR